MERPVVAEQVDQGDDLGSFQTGVRPDVFGHLSGDHHDGATQASCILHHPTHHLAGEGGPVQTPFSGDHQLGPSHPGGEAEMLRDHVVAGAQLAPECQDGPAGATGRSRTGDGAHVDPETLLERFGHRLKTRFEQPDLGGRCPLLGTEHRGGILERGFGVTCPHKRRPAQSSGRIKSFQKSRSPVGGGRAAQSDEDEAPGPNRPGGGGHQLTGSPGGRRHGVVAIATPDQFKTGGFGQLHHGERAIPDVGRFNRSSVRAVNHLEEQMTPGTGEDLKKSFASVGQWSGIGPEAEVSEDVGQQVGNPAGAGGSPELVGSHQNTIHVRPYRRPGRIRREPHHPWAPHHPLRTGSLR